MPTNPCAASPAGEGARCGHPAWFLDPATLQLFCHDHKPEHASDTFPALAAELLRDPSGAAEVLRDPGLRAFVAEVRAEIERRLAGAEETNVEPP
jgi:hypothetical protein